MERIVKARRRPTIRGEDGIALISTVGLRRAWRTRRREGFVDPRNCLSSTVGIATKAVEHVSQASERRAWNRPEQYSGIATSTRRPSWRRGCWLGIALSSTVGLRQLDCDWIRLNVDHLELP